MDLVVEDYRRRAQLGEVRSDAEPLAVLTAMRQIAAEFKLSAAEQLLYQLHQQGHAVVLFSAFIAPLQLLHQRIGGELMTGRQRPLERQQSVDRFQQGKSNCLLATYGTGSLGFTLFIALDMLCFWRGPGLLVISSRPKIAAIALGWVMGSPAIGCNLVPRISWWMVCWRARPNGSKSVSYTHLTLPTKA